MAIVIGGAAGILIIRAGVFDPIPAQPATMGESHLLHAAPGQPVQKWLAQVMPLDAGIFLAIAPQLVNPTAVYGWLLGEPNNHLSIQITPTGSAAIAWQKGATTMWLMESQPYPHVRLGAAENRFYLKREGDFVSIWLNRELMWEGEAAGLPPAAGIGAMAHAATNGIEVLFTLYPPKKR